MTNPAAVEPELSPPAKILVIRLKQIGDSLISLPVCKSLRQTFPEAQIDYLVYEHIAPLFDHHPAINNVLVITPAERRHRWRYFRKMRSIRRAGYDMVIDLLTVPITALMTRFSAAKWQLGFDKGKLRSRLYKTAVPHPPGLGSLDAKLAIFNGLPFDITIERTFDIIVQPAEIEAMRRRMAKAGINTEKPILLFSPISRLGIKNWPDEYFVKIVDHCLHNYDVDAVMIWGPTEHDEVTALAAKTRSPDRVCTAIETRDLRELAALSHIASLYIGNDSGPRHIAEAVGTPTFTIFSPAVSKLAWLPHRGERHQGIDMCDALDLDESTWHQLAPEFQRHMEDYYLKITPELVISRLEPMLRRFAR